MSEGCQTRRMFRHDYAVPGTYEVTMVVAGRRSETTVSAASAAESRPSLFEPNYNDHILMRDGQLDNWKRYLRDNPLRYMMRREYPDLFQRALCVTIGDTRYSAFGNMYKPTLLANIGNPSAAALRRAWR